MNVELPTNNVTDLASLARLAMAGIATTLATDGANVLVQSHIIASADVAQYISWGSALILGGAALVWAKIKNNSYGRKIVAAAATGDPQADVKSPAVQAAVAAAAVNPNSPITAKGAGT